MNPTSPQFNEGVNVIPGGSKPTTSNWTTRSVMPDYYKMITPPLPINSSTGGAETSRYAKGEQMQGKGEASKLVPPVGRPKPNQGTPGTKIGVTIGGEKPNAIKVTGPTAPKGPRLGGGGLRGPLGNFGGGSGGPFGKMD